MKQAEIQFGEALRDKGIAQAEQHAEAEAPGWKAQAAAFFTAYLLYTLEFQTEDVRAEAEKHGVPPPPDARAWGGIIREAAKHSMITKEGYRESKFAIAHRNPRAVWRSNLFLK